MTTYRNYYTYIIIYNICNSYMVARRKIWVGKDREYIIYGEAKPSRILYIPFLTHILLLATV